MSFSPPARRRELALVEVDVDAEEEEGGWRRGCSTREEAVVGEETERESEREGVVTMEIREGRRRCTVDEGEEGAIQNGGTKRMGGEGEKGGRSWRKERAGEGAS